MDALWTNLINPAKEHFVWVGILLRPAIFYTWINPKFVNSAKNDYLLTFRIFYFCGKHAYDKSISEVIKFSDIEAAIN